MIKKLLIALLIFTPSLALAVTGGSARADFVDGKPAVIDDQTNLCNNQATVRYDFVDGMPTQIYDSTATCTAAAPAGGVVDDGIIWFDSD